MSHLRPHKLYVKFGAGANPAGPITPRRYTLTHSDATGDLFLTIGADYDRSQISGWYTRLLRDEVLAEWLEEEARKTLRIYCHVSGGLVLGTAGWRYAIFQRELPLVLEALRYADDVLYHLYPALDQAPILVHFRSSRRQFNRVESWGVPADYRLARNE